ncbi:MAG: hypothetical protein CFE37_07510 [Alphaproteobacteria bacterium PA4]|nr:MAG: hypothetical protein CFE37_07510 [Alphaproteobacteria bacterium PA4]
MNQDEPSRPVPVPLVPPSNVATMMAERKALGGLLEQAFAPVLTTPLPDRIAALLRALDHKA